MDQQVMQKQNFVVYKQPYLIPQANRLEKYIKDIQRTNQLYIFCQKSPFYKLMLLLCILGAQSKNQLQQLINQQPKINLQIGQIDKIIQGLVPVDVNNFYDSFSQNVKKIKQNIKFLQKTLYSKMEEKHGDKVQKILESTDKIKNLQIKQVQDFEYKNIKGKQKSSNLINIFQINNNYIFAFLELANKQQDNNCQNKKDNIEIENDQQGNLFIIIMIIMILGLIYLNGNPGLFDNIINYNVQGVKNLGHIYQFK